jgi:hypothetical protein
MPSSLVARFLFVVLTILVFVQAASAQTPPPVLVTEALSTRAVAIDSSTFTSEPFRTTSPVVWNQDGRTRITLFVMNVALQPGEDISSLRTEAQDASGRRYDLRVEYFGKVPGLDWLHQIVVRLHDDMNETGDHLVSVAYRDRVSNRVRVGIGHVGGGPPDDVGAQPTPAPPYTIKGRISVAGVNVAGILVSLTGTQQAITPTDAEGFYSFTVSSVGNYTITPSKQNHEFSPQQFSFPLLTNSQQADFTARIIHSIRGRVYDASNSGIVGVTVTLGGAQSRTTTTDSDGRYTFEGLPAGESFNVSVAKTDFVFTPTTLFFEALESDVTGNFQGVQTFRISGQVVNSLGQSLFGTKVMLSGSSSETLRVGADGRYSFTVTTGNYTVTPSFEQGYYVFTPVRQTITGISSHQTINFVATFIQDIGPVNVLEFDGTPMTADHGLFWPGNTDLGHFFWEFWAMPGENAFARYLLSDGYGGAHALLFGFSSGDSEPGRYNFIGNIWMGTSLIYFSSDEGPAPGEWGHCAVGWDGTNIIIYFNGVPVGKTPFTGPRRTLGPDNGSGRLFIGGSDHQNLIGRIAQVRGYEDVNPRAGAPESTFTPETLFRPDGSFLSRYFRPVEPIADLSSAGYLGETHPGILRGVSNGYPSPCPNCPVPRLVVDPTAPRFTDIGNPGQIVAPVDTPASAPAGALVFDSFSRPNSTYILGGLGGLGTTEVGAAWVSNPASGGRQPFGILNGRAVLLADERVVAWTQVAANSLDIRVERRLNTIAAGKNTGICFRVVDGNNYFFAYTTGEGSQRLTVGHYLNGVRTEIAHNVELPGSWQRLRVVTWNDGRLSVYADELLLHSSIQALMANASGAGLYNEGPGMALTNRWDNFTVLVAP